MIRPAILIGFPDNVKGVKRAPTAAFTDSAHNSSGPDPFESIQNLNSETRLIHFTFQDLNALDQINDINKGMLHDFASFEGHICGSITEHHRRLR